MKVRRVLAFVTFLAAAGCGGGVRRLDACSAADVCTDVGNSLVGQINQQDIVITWSTSNEPGSGIAYRVKRYNCSDPPSCSSTVQNVPGAGTCGTLHGYQVTDTTPPTPLAQWRYSVEVISGGNRVCSYDVTPQ